MDIVVIYDRERILVAPVHEALALPSFVAVCMLSLIVMVTVDNAITYCHASSILIVNNQVPIVAQRHYFRTQGPRHTTASHPSDPNRRATAHHPARDWDDSGEFRGPSE